MSLESWIQSCNWIKLRKARPNCKLRLLCFTYAGGSAMLFRTWSDKLPDFVEVCPIELPGRMSRSNEPSVTNWRDLVSEIVEELKPLLRDKPFALFGHSLGSLLSFEVARYIQKHAITSQPLVALFVSARRPNHLKRLVSPIHHLSNREFAEEVHKRFDSMADVLANPSLLDIVIPPMKADFCLVETYEYEEGEKLSCPIFAFGGTADPFVDEESLRAWSELSIGETHVVMMDGDHFSYVTKSPTVLLETIAQNLSDLVQQHGW
eukprot:TRINITY_DN14135_c0_g1_i1.p1 TRINITY_DN14135_c0_g1~~TRINITY_DN14135_c0_g1_i1.p1  ORF type:complete len:276 (-),score=18.53 TRINITY_DN14135_c0_g1_i1:286-1077(-)